MFDKEKAAKLINLDGRKGVDLYVSRLVKCSLEGHEGKMARQCRGCTDDRSWLKRAGISVSLSIKDVG